MKGSGAPVGHKVLHIWCELHQEQGSAHTQVYCSRNICNLLPLIMRAEKDQESNKFWHHTQIFNQDRDTDDISMEQYCCSCV